MCDKINNILEVKLNFRALYTTVLLIKYLI